MKQLVGGRGQGEALAKGESDQGGSVGRPSIYSVNIEYPTKHLVGEIDARGSKGEIRQWEALIPSYLEYSTKHLEGGRDQGEALYLEYSTKHLKHSDEA